MGALEKKGLLYSLRVRDWVFGIITCPTNLWDNFTRVLGIGFIVFLIPGISLLPIHAQDLRTYPTQEELKRAEEILREFQKPEERVKELGFGYSGSGIGKSQTPNTEDKTPNPQLSKPEHGKLLYFFSFSMPTQSLKTILPEVEKTGAVMVLRGMKEEEGLKATVIKIADLLKHGEKESYQVEVWIHPVLFTCFNIDSVPQIVYITGTQDEKGCSSDYIKVKGDVSIQYALRLIAKEDKSAKKYLKLLEDSFYEKN
jgi:type-F conjugative transfer system pilin assembly protein TrbC